MLGRKGQGKSGEVRKLCLGERGLKVGATREVALRGKRIPAVKAKEGALTPSGGRREE